MNPLDLTPDEQLQWLKHGAADIAPEAELAAKLKRSRETGKPLRVKLGMDPSAPDVHLGHTVVLRKLRQFQQLGHEVILIIGDFTAMIGDPTGKSDTRKPLTPDDVRANAQTYADQVFRVLDPERTRLTYNNDWLGPMTFAEVVQLTSRYTVARLLERDDFQKRYAENRPIAVHEFMYAFAQSYDSVHLRADVELGGTDQRFNILMGRDIQESHGLPAQVGVFMPILVGLDGVQKMSKSLGNYIGVSEPPSEMFSKLMSISDTAMPEYFRLLTDVPQSEYAPLAADAPMEAKKRLAGVVTGMYHSQPAAAAAREEWEKVHSRREIPTEMPDVTIPADAFKEDGRIWIGRLLTAAGLAPSTREARRLVDQGGVSINGERVSDPDAELELQDGSVLQVGRRKFARVHRG
ncbi:MAG: tyrosine--tRNA ligase [Actinomycetota bacterium]